MGRRRNPGTTRRVTLLSAALLGFACGPSELALGLPEAAGMKSALLGIGTSGSGFSFEELYALDPLSQDGLSKVRPLEAGPEAPPIRLELLFFSCDLGALGLDVGPVAISPELGIEPPPTSCLFEVELKAELDAVRWSAASMPSAAVRSLRYASREPTCPRDANAHRCPDTL